MMRLDSSETFGFPRAHSCGNLVYDQDYVVVLGLQLVVLEGNGLGESHWWEHVVKTGACRKSTYTHGLLYL
jgi:hypothetical protein